MHFVAISGSLRKRSFNTALLRTLTELAPEGVTVDIVTLDDIPFYNEDVEIQGIPTAVADLKNRIEQADGVIFSVPEYNYSYSGVLKNSLDWLSRGPIRPLQQKPVLLVGAATGNGGTIRAQVALRTVLFHLDALPMNRPELLITQARSKFDEDLRLSDEVTRGVVEKILQSFVSWVNRTSLMKEAV
ncbi:MAG TPA: NADPH-dependent FMN reductase [Chlorobiota bacterium]|nr:NADPH-dependent FMN reductase [Chlorobiota bacterium]